MVPGSAMITLVEAIARQEGFGKPGTRATRNHNPGNLNWGKFASDHGSIGADDKHYAIFDSNQAGFAALRALLGSKSYKGMTVKDAIFKYCPAHDPRGENDSMNYVSNVCHWCECEPNTLVDDKLIGELPEAVVDTHHQPHGG